MSTFEPFEHFSAIYAELPFYRNPDYGTGITPVIGK
jgi:hypothetical protein